MALEALTSNEFLNFIIYDTISATPQQIISSCHLDDHQPLDINNSTTCTTTTTSTNSIPHHHSINGGYPVVEHHEMSIGNNSQQQQQQGGYSSCLIDGHEGGGGVAAGRRREVVGVLGVQGGVGRKRRRRKPRVCKNKEEAETQRMTHIAVERNRRKQMNEHLAVLRSLMPESYVQRGDQASIVGGAIGFVKELEHLLQSLEAQKFQLLQGLEGPNCKDTNIISSSSTSAANNNNQNSPPPFSQFFVYPQYTWSQLPNNNNNNKLFITSSKTSTKASIADIEVTLIETHASMRILSRRSPRQLSKLVSAFQSLHLSILHINVTTMDPLVLYSISAKLDEECRLNTVDDIAGAVHHMLRIIEEEEEAALLLVDDHHQIN